MRQLETASATCGIYIQNTTFILFIFLIFFSIVFYIFYTVFKLIFYFSMEQL